MLHPSRALVVLALCGSLPGCALYLESSEETASGVRPMISIDGTRVEVGGPLENGRAMLLTGQYGLAVTVLSRVVEEQPRNVRALTLLAEAYGRLRRFDLADRYHAEALMIDPNAVATLNNWGYSYLVRGETARALGLLERAVAIKSDQPVVRANLQLAIGNTDVDQAVAVSAPPAAATGNVLISDHVTMLRRTGMLVRLAPGVQLLVTEAQALAALQPDAPSKPAADSTPALPYIAAGAGQDDDDSRARIFQALFSLMEAPTSAPETDIFAAAPIKFVAP